MDNNQNNNHEQPILEHSDSLRSNSSREGPSRPRSGSDPLLPPPRKKVNPTDYPAVKKASDERTNTLRDFKREALEFQAKTESKLKRLKKKTLEEQKIEDAKLLHQLIGASEKIKILEVKPKKVENPSFSSGSSFYSSISPHFDNTNNHSSAQTASAAFPHLEDPAIGQGFFNDNISRESNANESEEKQIHRYRYGSTETESNADLSQYWTLKPNGEILFDIPGIAKGNVTLKEVLNQCKEFIEDLNKEKNMNQEEKKSKEIQTKKSGTSERQIVDVLENNLTSQSFQTQCVALQNSFLIDSSNFEKEQIQPLADWALGEWLKRLHARVFWEFSEGNLRYTDYGQKIATQDKDVLVKDLVSLNKGVCKIMLKEGVMKLYKNHDSLGIYILNDPYGLIHDQGYVALPHQVIELCKERILSSRPYTMEENAKYYIAQTLCELPTTVSTTTSQFVGIAGASIEKSSQAIGVAAKAAIYYPGRIAAGATDFVGESIVRASQFINFAPIGYLGGLFKNVAHITGQSSDFVGEITYQTLNQTGGLVGRQVVGASENLGRVLKEKNLEIRISVNQKRFVREANSILQYVYNVEMREILQAFRKKEHPFKIVSDSAKRVIHNVSVNLPNPTNYVAARANLNRQPQLLPSATSSIASNQKEYSYRGPLGMPYDQPAPSAPPEPESSGYFVTHSEGSAICIGRVKADVGDQPAISNRADVMISVEAPQTANQIDSETLVKRFGYRSFSFPSISVPTFFHLSPARAIAFGNITYGTVISWTIIGLTLTTIALLGSFATNVASVVVAPAWSGVSFLFVHSFFFVRRIIRFFFFVTLGRLFEKSSSRKQLPGPLINLSQKDEQKKSSTDSTTKRTKSSESQNNLSDVKKLDTKSSIDEAKRRFRNLQNKPKKPPQK